MIHQNFYPSRIADQVTWLTNFKTKIPAQGPVLSLSSTVIANATADCLWLIYVNGAWLSALRAFSQSGTQYLTLIQTGPTGGSALPVPTFTVPAIPAGTVPVAAGALNRIFKLIADIKNSASYTETIGEDLGIIGAAENPDDHPVPKFNLALIVGSGGAQQVQINFTKYTHQGVYVESRRGSGNWEFLAIDTERPYIDERPLLVAGTPEAREYRLRYWDKGTPNGPWTDTAKITVGV